jgi:GT2 family glycosyltransferase
VDLSICILTHNQPKLLPDCVAACISQVERARMRAEIIVVDNGSANAYPQRLAGTYPQVTVIRSEQNLGFSAGNNLAIRLSRGRCVLVLNDDAILQENSLRLMHEKLASDPQIGALGPKLLNPDGSVQKGFSNKRSITLRSLICDVLYLGQFFGKWEPTRCALTRLGNDEHSGEANEIAGACLLVRREALDEVGLFDEVFHRWFEDTDLCYRLSKAGWKLVYLAEARAIHYGSTSFKLLERSETTRMFYESEMRFLRKHWRPRRYRASKVVLTLAFTVRALIAFVYRIWRHRGRLREARQSARTSLGIARWLLTECE